MNKSKSLFAALDVTTIFVRNHVKNWVTLPCNDLDQLQKFAIAKHSPI